MTQTQDPMVRRTFIEVDEPMIGVCQLVMGNTDPLSLTPVAEQGIGSNGNSAFLFN